MQYPTIYERQIPERWAGKTLNDASLAKWLTDTFEARLIGRLVKGPAWPEPKLDTGKPKEMTVKNLPPGVYIRKADGASDFGLTNKRSHDETFQDVSTRATRRKHE